MTKAQDDFKKKINEFIEAAEKEKALGFPKAKLKKNSQGQDKLLRLVDDLVRNQKFVGHLKKVIEFRSDDKLKFLKGGYHSWTKEEKADHDHYNKEGTDIANEYEKLKLRAEKLIHDEEYEARKKIAFDYGLDNWLINLAIAKYTNDTSWVDSMINLYYVDMCRMRESIEYEMYPVNKAEEIIHTQPNRQLELFAFPISISIHRNASKRDVIDYIEKNWKKIDNKLRNDYGEKTLKIRKRKHSQKMLDCIWENKELPPLKIKQKLEVEFPKNLLQYNEISKIIRLEKEKRLGN